MLVVGSADPIDRVLFFPLFIRQALMYRRRKHRSDLIIFPGIARNFREQFAVLIAEYVLTQKLLVQGEDDLLKVFGLCDSDLAEFIREFNVKVSEEEMNELVFSEEVTVLRLLRFIQKHSP